MTTASARKSGTDPSLDDYIKHAERFGVKCVYETAEQLRLPALELGYLCRHLRRINKHWRLEPAQRTRLVRDLLEAVVPDNEIRDMAKVSQDTVSRVRQESKTSVSSRQDPATMRREVRKSKWDREYPYQTVSRYFSATERLSWPALYQTVEALS